ncbi:hypothetical protein ACHAWF_008598 [Thalassiosira exigua]
MISQRAFLPTLLAIVVAATSASVGIAADDEDSRSLRSIMCVGMAIMGLGSITDCCPAGSDDSFCVLLECVDTDNLDMDNLDRDSLGGIELRPDTDCTCTDIVNVCPDILPFAGILECIQPMCDQVNACCNADGSTTNANAEACMREAVEDGTLDAPAIASILGDTPIFKPEPVIISEPDTAASDPVAIAPSEPSQLEPGHELEMEMSMSSVDGA